MTTAVSSGAPAPSETSQHGHHHHPELEHHFEDLNQQRDTVTLGMWVFLVQEIMFFGGLFLGFMYYRSMYTEAFNAASRHLDIQWGTINTVVLIGSSLTMALAVGKAQRGNRSGVIGWMLATGGLGLTFLGIKAVEYTAKWQHGLVPGRSFLSGDHHGVDDLLGFAGNAELFYGFYFVMTGMHALHMVIGMGLMAWVISETMKGKVTENRHGIVENFGLYWHFVDIVWIFLFPFLYLLGR